MIAADALGEGWVVMSTGRRDVALRWGTPDDREELIYGFEQLSPESRVTRFFSAMPRLDGVVLQSLLDVGAPHHVAVAAFDVHAGTNGDLAVAGRGIGVARLITHRDDPRTAELAVTVIDSAQRQGIGRLMVEALVVTAPRCDVEVIEAYVMATNPAMVNLLRSLGAEVQPYHDEPGVRWLTLDVAAARRQVATEQPERMVLLEQLAALPLP